MKRKFNQAKQLNDQLKRKIIELEDGANELFQNAK